MLARLLGWGCYPLIAILRDAITRACVTPRLPNLHSACSLVVANTNIVCSCSALQVFW
jgi:hypothetical protein